jgi:uncharacterized protein (TIGR02246 family)
MAGEMTAVVQRMFEALDKGDVEGALGAMASEVQGIDEVSRRWMRGRDEVVGHTRDLMTRATDVHSEMHDVHESEWGDTGAVTFWLEQDYTFEEAREHVSAPTTCILRSEAGDWRIALFHSIPIGPNG